MSYILEALKKAEQQRELGRVPGIGSEHDAPAAGARRHGLWLLVLTLNAGVLALLLWPERHAEPPAGDGSEVEVAVAKPRSGSPTVIRAPTPPQEGPSGGSMEQPPAAQPVPPRTLERATAAPGPVEVPATAESNTTPTAGPVPTPRPEPSVQAAPLAVWPQIPPELFAQIQGGLHLDVHVYSEQPLNRFVLINLRKYHQGDALQEGPILDEITPEGVILSFRGQRFRMQRQ